MCEKKKGLHNRIDFCMRTFIENLKMFGRKSDYVIVASCCGHKKYPMTIVILDKNWRVFDLVSGVVIPQKRNFYKKDEQGYYFIPEVISNQLNTKQKGGSKNGRR
jgi:hypothetical protein